MLGLENLYVRIKANECDVDLLGAALYTCYFFGRCRINAVISQMTTSPKLLLFPFHRLVVFFRSANINSK